jgi:hypothetical protein
MLLEEAVRARESWRGEKGGAGALSDATGKRRVAADGRERTEVECARLREMVEVVRRGDRLLVVFATAGDENVNLWKQPETIRGRMCEEETELVRLREALANAEFPSAI